MASSGLVDNLAEELHKIKCKHGHDKTCKTSGIKYKDCECCLKYAKVKDDLILYKCLCYNRNYRKKFDENLKNQLANTYKFSKHGVIKLILLLQKCVYPYKLMDG